MKNFKEITKKIDAKQLWTIAGLIATVAGAIISDKSKTTEYQSIKNELKDELRKELLNGKN